MKLEKGTKPRFVLSSKVANSTSSEQKKPKHAWTQPLTSSPKQSPDNAGLEVFQAVSTKESEELKNLHVIRKSIYTKLYPKINECHTITETSTEQENPGQN
jgi:hypothetical protein